MLVVLLARSGYRGDWGGSLEIWVVRKRRSDPDGVPENGVGAEGCKRANIAAWNYGLKKKGSGLVEKQCRV